MATAFNISLSDVVHWCGWPCLVNQINEETIRLINHAGKIVDYKRVDIMRDEDGFLYIDPRVI